MPFKPAKASAVTPKDQFAIATVGAVAGEITPAMIAQGLAEAMQATTTNRDGTFPDYRVRLQAIQLAIETTIGRAVQRQEIVHKEVKGEEGTLDAIIASPAALAALEAKISEAKRRQDVARLVVVNA
jgi:hypothetical protein